MNALQTRRPRRVRDARGAGVALLVVLLLATLAAVAAGCGAAASGTPAAGATPTAIQVMATATRGDLYLYAMGIAKVTAAGARPVVVATVAAQEASTVSKGQTATVSFMSGRFRRFGQGGTPQPQSSGQPQGAASGMPQPQGSGMPVPSGGTSGAPFSRSGGQGGGFFGGGQGGVPGGAGGGVTGTVTAVKANVDGTAAVTISVAKLPSRAKLGSFGFARIQVKLLAQDAVLIPTAAVTGSGSSATVQVSAGGKTEKRTITVGQQSGAMSQVVSGLSAGENVVYTRSFRGFPGGGMRFRQGGQSGMPFPQQGGQSQSGGTY